jgi:hypothetical protein
LEPLADLPLVARGDPSPVLLKERMLARVPPAVSMPASAGAVTPLVLDNPPNGEYRTEELGGFEEEIVTYVGVHDGWFLIRRG